MVLPQPGHRTRSRSRSRSKSRRRSGISGRQVVHHTRLKIAENRRKRLQREEEAEKARLANLRERGSKNNDSGGNADEPPGLLQNLIAGTVVIFIIYFIFLLFPPLYEWFRQKIGYK